MPSRTRFARRASVAALWWRSATRSWNGSREPCDRRLRGSVTTAARHSRKDRVTPSQIRLPLAQLAFAALAPAEVSLDPHARTVDSLRALGLDDPVFLIGADEFASFPTWTSPEEVLRLARLGVATRPGVDT